jgi:hypothetical protein
MKKLFQLSTLIAFVIITTTGCSVVNKTAGVDRSTFIGSTWVLTNSGNGQYTLTDGTSQSIYWSYNNPGNGVTPSFQFKKVYQGDKPKNVDTGYNLIIGGNDGTIMVLKTPIAMGNSTGYVVYNFTKAK